MIYKIGYIDLLLLVYAISLHLYNSFVISNCSMHYFIQVLALLCLMIAVLVIVARLRIAIVIKCAMYLMIAVLIFRKSVLHVSKHIRVLYTFIRNYVFIMNNCSFRLVTIIATFSY